MRHIDAQDGFYSKGLGRYIYHDHEPMGDIFSDIGNSISNAANAALHTIEQKGQAIVGQAPAALAATEQSGLSKLWATFFGTPTGQAVQASGVKGYLNDYLPASLQAKYNANSVLYNTIIFGALGITAYMFLVPKKHRNKTLDAIGSAPGTVINLVMPKAEAAKEAVKEAASIPAPSAEVVKANPILSLMGFANPRKSHSKRRKSRRPARR